MASISVIPSSSLMDEKVIISVTGLAPGSPVTIRSSVTETTKRFQGWAHFVADQDGRVSLDKEPSIGGTYTGVEPMGMFWSLQASPGQRLGIRFAKKYPYTPVVVLLSVHRGHLGETRLAADEPIQVAVVHKWYMRQADVDRIKLAGHESLRGVVYKPKGPGPFPGVLDMFGTAGGLMEFRAALLASRGYASYALPIFAYEDLSETMLNVDFEYFEEALKWFEAESYVQPGGIGIVASSLGGSIGLHLALQYPELIKASAFVSCPPFMPNVTLNYRGKALPFVWFDTEATIFDDEGVLHPLTGWPAARDVRDEEFIEVRMTNLTEVTNYLQIENIACPVLFMGGSADECVPILDYLSEAFRRRGVSGRHNFEVVRFEGAGHILEPPYGPVCTFAYVNVMDIVMALGGRPKEHARAQEAAWARILAFLKKHVGSGVDQGSDRDPDRPTDSNRETTRSKL